ncbi:MAG: glycoside hydrolase family 2 [Clostridia bacterium]|nr:glycoside hydrolase family 2 [Clostridia bacterium]
MTEFVSLTTDFEKDLEKIPIPFPDYPRPQMKRDSWLCLNGEWNFCIENRGQPVYNGKITVPFVPESRISGVMKDIKNDDLLIYECKVDLLDSFVKDRILLHIGACDQYADVYVNGKSVGRNVGGYLPFSFDITDAAVIGENTVRIVACDPLCLDLPYGKQTEKRGGMWYTKISGLWQTVWIESVCENYIKDLKITPDLFGADIHVTGGEDRKVIRLLGKEYAFTGDYFRLDISEPHLWSPDDPYLYEFELVSGKDTVKSYFGLRTVEIKTVNETPLICLNGKPLFFNGLLDQGYFSDGIFLPASPRGFEEDILKMKNCGFNMLRKHIKLEPDLFYYYCDRHGMLVFQDMINSGKYSFFLDTALPTVLLKKGISHRANKSRRLAFENTCKGIISNLYNHPSVVYYTIFNEGWGQFDADKYYDLFRSLDKTRIWDTTSGWFKTKKSDVESEHIYFKPVKLKKSKRPLVLSEFGGYSCKIKDHAFNLDKTYGYRYFDDMKKFEDALVSLYENEIMPSFSNGLCAAVLTQVSDVEDETNGILTYDRKVRKVDPERMKELFNRLYSEFDRLYN